MVRVNHDINMLRHTFETLQLIWLVGITQMLFIVLHDVDWLITLKIKLEPEQYRPQDTMAAVAISQHE